MPVKDSFVCRISIASCGTRADPQWRSFGRLYAIARCFCLTRRHRLSTLKQMPSSSGLSRPSYRTSPSVYRVRCGVRADGQLISIAHRLQTVAYYDRILVMDAGRVAEVNPCGYFMLADGQFDTPLNLFDSPGSAFRSLCDTKVNYLARITRTCADMIENQPDGSGQDTE